MNLSFEEELLLALYLELYNKEYDINDNRLAEIEPKDFLRHIEMQTAIYLFQSMGLPLDYGFIPYLHGINSQKLKVILFMLDKKGKEIQTFYSTPQNKNYGYHVHHVETSLEKYLTRNNIKKVETACVLFRNFINKDGVSEYLSKLIYTSKNIMPGSNFTKINKYLEEQDSKIHNTLSEIMWQNIQALGIIPIEIPELLRKK